MPTAQANTKKASKAVETKSFADKEINQKLSSEEKTHLLREMIRIRRFEERSLKAYQQNYIGGFLHLYIGQESVAVGCASLCGDNDHMITAYRDHAHALAVGMTMDECMAELYGKATGCSKGKGGSMHFFAPDKNYWGGHGIVGGQTPIGLGLAYALKYKGLKGCCMCFLGDGAVNQGAFHESLNIAALWDLPIIYIIENNGYSMGTSQVRSSAYKDCLAKRGEGYDMDWVFCEGHDVYAVRHYVAEAIERAHDQSRPTLMEIATYRYRGHSVADANAEKYRAKEEIETYKKTRDPINIFKEKLLAESVLTEDDYKKMDKEAKAEAEASAKFAEESPYPEVGSITEDVYWETDNGRTSEGRIFFNDELDQ
ncbi:MAG: pyruvate dehydrogenase (acetyl-transferring) E1 component subunit alpha [Verrucomicrobiota bacterium]